MKIHVRTFTNQTLSLTVTPTDTIFSLKKQIEEVEEISVQRQRLIFAGLELNNEQVISYYSLIQEGSKLICESTELMVILPNSDIVVFPIESTNTVDHIKRLIEFKSKIPKNEQYLFYSCCSHRGRQLDDSKTIFDNNIEGNLVYVLNDLKTSQLFIEILETTRTIINVSINLNDTILNIKQKVQSNTLNNIMNYKLFYQDNELDDCKTLTHYHIQDRTVLQLCENKIIFVKRLTDEKIKLKVDISDSIAVIKRKIQNLLNVPFFHQKLYFHGTKLDDDKSLLYYNIGYGMKLQLETGNKVFIISSFRSKTLLEYQNDDTVGLLKQAIRVKIGIPEEFQCLIKDGVELIDNDKVSHYFMNESQPVYKLELYVRSGNKLILKVIVDDTVFFVEAVPSDDIAFIKHKVELKMSESLRRRICYFGSEYLNDYRKLAETAVQNMSILRMVKPDESSFPIFLKSYQDSQSFSLLVTHADTIEDIKIRYSDHTGIPGDQIRFIYAGKQLSDGWTVSDYNLERECTIHVVQRLRGC